MLKSGGVFNIKGNSYRIVYVRFVGTCEQYDQIDAETV